MLLEWLVSVCFYGYRHDGAVWQVAWAHPKYGNILASCSYDRKVRSNSFRGPPLHVSKCSDSMIYTILWFGCCCYGYT